MNTRPPRLFQLLIRLLPPEFRKQFGPGILQVLHEGYARAGDRGAFHRTLFITRATVNLLWSAVRERGRPSMERRPRAEKRQHPISSSIAGFSNSWTRDLRIAVRTLRHRPSFTFIVIVTLALGIGANSAVFTVLESVILADLPYAAPERLVRLHLFRLDRGTEARGEYLSEPFVLELASQTEIFSNLTAMNTYREDGADLSLGDRAMRLTVFPVSADYFEVLGVAPATGRGFDAADQGTRVVMLSHAVWSQTFGSDPDIAGRTIQLDGLPYRVAGVMPRGFRNPLGYAADLWTLLDLRTRDWESWEWENHYLGVIARLTPGLTIATAEQRLDAFARALTERVPLANDMGVRLQSLRDDTVGSARTMIWLLMAAVGLLLFTACVNVANLFLVHSAGRSHEFAVRSALGARKRELIRQLLAESLLLSAAGGVVGLALAFGGVRGLLLFGPQSLPRAEEISIGAGVLAFTAVAAIGTGMVFGLAPAWRLRSAELTRGLGQGKTRTGIGIERSRLYGALIVLQVATSLVLLIGAGLLTKSFIILRHVDLGIEPEGSLLFEVHLPDTRYPDPAARIAFHHTFYERLRGLPDVTEVGAVDWLPAHTRYHPWGFNRLDLPEQYEGDGRGEADARVIAGEYFDVSGLTLLRGRSFTLADSPDVPRVAAISRRGVEQNFPDEEVLGKRIRLLGRTWEIVGVVEDVPYDPQGGVVPVVYLPHDQFAENRNWQLFHVVSTPRNPVDLIPSIRAVLREMDPELVLYRPRPFEDAFSDVVAQERFATSLISLFAAIAFTLAIVGVYGVVSYVASNRRREIGIRLALGAERRHVRGLVTRQALALTGTGIALGLLAAVLLTRWLESMIFAIETTDLTVFVAVIVAFGGAAWLAGLFPARRAARTEPVRVLRDEGG